MHFLNYFHCYHYGDGQINFIFKWSLLPYDLITVINLISKTRKMNIQDDRLHHGLINLFSLWQSNTIWTLIFYMEYTTMIICQAFQLLLLRHINFVPLKPIWRYHSPQNNYVRLQYTFSLNSVGYYRCTALMVKWLVVVFYHIILA